MEWEEREGEPGPTSIRLAVSLTRSQRVGSGAGGGREQHGPSHTAQRVGGGGSPAAGLSSRAGLLLVVCQDQNTNRLSQVQGITVEVSHEQPLGVILLTFDLRRRSEPREGGEGLLNSSQWRDGGGLLHRHDLDIIIIIIIITLHLRPLTSGTFFVFLFFSVAFLVLRLDLRCRFRFLAVRLGATPLFIRASLLDLHPGGESFTPVRISSPFSSLLFLAVTSSSSSSSSTPPSTLLLSSASSHAIPLSTLDPPPLRLLPPAARCLERVSNLRHERGLRLAAGQGTGPVSPHLPGTGTGSMWSPAGLHSRVDLRAQWMPCSSRAGVILQPAPDVGDSPGRRSVDSPGRRSVDSPGRRSAWAPEPGNPDDSFSSSFAPLPTSANSSYLIGGDVSVQSEGWTEPGDVCRRPGPAGLERAGGDEPLRGARSGVEEPGNHRPHDLSLIMKLEQDMTLLWSRSTGIVDGLHGDLILEDLRGSPLWFNRNLSWSEEH
ncbi:hypothetical protein N1851_005833 [Merluccius polli]|uniref:Uncharacterized protein n=1 Tax=Merluccius polli TaxID=89951 RepID=A0AA47N6S5_MERPO|nr:hypothetical protein N1851_005833 [Merluccius polli]